jgi:predicted ArsR family transcriptional regulator
MADPNRADDIRGIAALEHVLSRAAYELVAERGWVTRDTAAAALDVPRSVAAFHLDKLADAGLLGSHYERTSGRTGPGAGRPSKVYTRVAREISVSLPPRRYDLAGSVLAEAVDRAAAADIPVKQVLAEVAREAGHDIAEESAGSRRARDSVMEILLRHGYEPRQKGPEIALLNCPFHALAEQHRDLVCGMNLELLAGVLEGLTGAKLTARLAPEPGYCCVRLTARQPVPQGSKANKS